MFVSRDDFFSHRVFRLQASGFRLGIIMTKDHEQLDRQYGDILRAMEKLIAALDQRTWSLEPGAWSLEPAAILVAAVRPR